jgi:hypothetical protein
MPYPGHEHLSDDVPSRTRAPRSRRLLDRRPRHWRDRHVTDDSGRRAVEEFLSWAREAIASDPTHLADVQKALEETVMPPELRRVVEAELERLSAERRPSLPLAD